MRLLLLALLCWIAAPAAAQDDGPPDDRPEVEALLDELAELVSKSSREEHTRFMDGAGNEIGVKPGATWVQFVPADKQVTVE